VRPGVRKPSGQGLLEAADRFEAEAEGRSLDDDFIPRRAASCLRIAGMMRRLADVARRGGRA